MSTKDLINFYLINTHPGSAPSEQFKKKKLFVFLFCFLHFLSHHMNKMQLFCKQGVKSGHKQQ